MKTLNLLSIVLLSTFVIASANAESKKVTKVKASSPAAQSAPSASAPSHSYSRPYGMAGCGLGHYVVGKGGNQILSATTNGTAWNQTFGITFGTLDCEDSAKMASTASRLDNFIATNKAAVASDAAKGEGETIAVLAKLMNCSDASHLGTSLQSNFGTIFNRYDLTANEISDNLLSVVVSDQNLSAQCKVSI